MRTAQDQPDEPALAQRASDATNRRHSAWYVVGLLAAMALATALRFHALGAEDYWLDEIHSMVNSAGRRAEFETMPHGVILDEAPRFTDLTTDSNWAAVWRGMKADTHPPTFFLLLQSWRRLVGDGELLARVPAACFSILSILPVSLILWIHGRRGSAVLMAFILALSFSHIHVAQQCRPYSLGMLLVCAGYASLVKMDASWNELTRRQRFLWAAGYGLCLYLAALTHYFTILALLGVGMLCLVRFRGAVRRVCIGVALMAGIAFVITWGRQMIGQHELMSQQIWLYERHPRHLLRTLLRAADMPIRLLFEHQRFQLSWLSSIAGFVIVAGSFCILRRRRCPSVSVFVGWYLSVTVTLAAIDMLTGRQLLAHVRYISIAAPGLVGIMILAATRLRPALRWLVVSTFLVAALVTLRLPTQINPHNRLAAKLIAERVQPDSLLIFDAIDWQPFWVSQMYHNVAYYLAETMPGRLPPVVLLRDKPDIALLEEIKEYDHVVVVSPRVDKQPNPAADRYRLIDRTSYVRQVGRIYVFAQRETGGGVQ